jgi:hypothetical protein
MSRVGTLFIAIVPPIIVGGLLFVSESGHADAGRDGSLGFWPASSDTATGVVVAQADPRPRRPRPPLPPAAPVPGVPAVPPPPPAAAPPGVPGHGRHGMSISIHDGKVEIDGIAEMVEEQLNTVLRALDHMPNVAPDARDRVKTRVRGVRDKVKARLSKLRSMDIDKIGPEVERIGDEIEKEMEGVDKDLEQLGDKLSKHFAEKFGKEFGKDIAKTIAPRIAGADNSDGEDDDDDGDDEDKDAVVMPPHVDRLVPPDLDERIAALRRLNLSLNAEKREKLAKVRADCDREIADARRELDEMSNHLHETLGDAAAKESDIDRQIDKISAKEAAIRKARIHALIRTRSVLGDQSKLVEDALKKRR